jgi:hypothetical protein
MNNCIIDIDNKIKIYQNNELYFLIEKDSKWNYSIKISFSINEEINYLNLFLILKSYALNNICLTYAIGTCFYDINGKNIITQKESITQIKKMNFDNFVEWINYRIKNDWEYNKSKNFYAILIIFEKNLVILNNKKYGINILEHLKPTYPWKHEWIHYFEKSIEYTKMLEVKIKALEEELKKK